MHPGITEEAWAKLDIAMAAFISLSMEAIINPSVAAFNPSTTTMVMPGTTLAALTNLSLSSTDRFLYTEAVGAMIKVPAIIITALMPLSRDQSNTSIKVAFTSRATGLVAIMATFPSFHGKNLSRPWPMLSSGISSSPWTVAVSIVLGTGLTKMDTRTTFASRVDFTSG